MKKVLEVSEIDNAIILEVYNNSHKYGGTNAYKLGKPEEIKQFLERLFKVLQLENQLKWEVRQ